MIYGIEEIRRMCAPIFHERNLKKVYLFGSYARNKATERSDLDFLIDAEGSSLKDLFDQINLQNDLEKALGKKVDLVTLRAMNDKINQKRTPGFRENVMKEWVVVYDPISCNEKTK